MLGVLVVGTDVISSSDIWRVMMYVRYKCVWQCHCSELSHISHFQRPPRPTQTRVSAGTGTPRTAGLVALRPG